MLNSRNIALLLLTTTIMSLSAPVLAAEDVKNPYADNLLGSWGGVRNSLSDAGVDVKVEYTGDVMSLVSGGKKRGSNYMDSVDLIFEIDGEKAFGIKNNKAMFWMFNNTGGKPNRRVGSVEGINNLEVSTNTATVYEAWVEQGFFDNNLSVLVGLHDSNAEFAVTDMTNNFIKPTLQLGQSFAQGGQNGPSVFPVTSLAGRVTVTPTDETYISVGAFDGVPGNPNNPHGTHVDLRSKDGLLWVAEVGYTPKMPDGVEDKLNKFAVGAWTFTKKQDDLVDVDANGDPVKQKQAGAYFLSSYQIYRDQSARDIGVFLRGGIADGNTAQVNWEYVTGVVGHGWVPTRADGEIGFGFTQSHNSNTYQRSLTTAGDSSEYGFELYYRDSIYKGVTVQPDIQYVVNPGSDKAVKNASIVGLRLGIKF
jgi:porin